MAWVSDPPLLSIGGRGWDNSGSFLCRRAYLFAGEISIFAAMPRTRMTMPNLNLAVASRLWLGT